MYNIEKTMYTFYLKLTRVQFNRDHFSIWKILKNLISFTFDFKKLITKSNLIFNYHISIDIILLHKNTCV